MKRLIICLMVASLAAAGPALADRQHGGGGHPAMAHAAPRAHVARPATRSSAHRSAMHRSFRPSARHRPAHHFTRHTGHRAHHAARHAVHHAVRHATHATAAHRDERFAKVRRSVRAMRRFHAGAYRRPAGWYSHHWVIGERLPGAWFARDYWISDWAVYGLWAPIDGLIWVRVGPDAVLVDPSGGAVVGIEYGLFF